MTLFAALGLALLALFFNGLWRARFRPRGGTQPFDPPFYESASGVDPVE